MYTDSQPIYLQIAEGIMDEIQSGQYGPDDRLPSVREHAARVEVNANTVMRSYEWLQNREIIYNRRGIGFFVSPGAVERIIERRREQFFGEEASYFFGRLAAFGLTPADLAALYADYLDQAK